jgi:hypothetical protein
MGKGLKLMLKGAVSPSEMWGSGRKDRAVSNIFARVQEFKHGE